MTSRNRPGCIIVQLSDTIQNIKYAAIICCSSEALDNRHTQEDLDSLVYSTIQPRDQHPQVTQLRPADLIGRPVACSRSATRSESRSPASPPLRLQPPSFFYLSLPFLFFIPSPSIPYRLFPSQILTFFRRNWFRFFTLLSLIANMKAPFIAAAALLAGGASAEVHKLKLNKVPLEEQLVSLTYFASPGSSGIYKK